MLFESRALEDNEETQLTSPLLGLEVTPNRNSALPFSVTGLLEDNPPDEPNILEEEVAAFAPPNTNPEPGDLLPEAGALEGNDEETPNLKLDSDLSAAPNLKFPVNTFEVLTEPGFRDSQLRHLLEAALLLTRHTSHSQSPAALLNWAPKPCVAGGREVVVTPDLAESQAMHLLRASLFVTRQTEQSHEPAALLKDAPKPTVVTILLLLLAEALGVVAKVVVIALLLDSTVDLQLTVGEE